MTDHASRRPCRLCGSHLVETFADLGMSPLSNSFVPPERARAMEPTYPLHAWVCSECRLVQLEEFESPAHIFSDYLYFSSFSESWLRHAEAYADAMVARFGLGPQSKVVEIASNDGYLLQWFLKRGCQVLGVEPAANVAAVAVAKGIPSEVAFFGVATAERLRAAGHGADQMAANNVLAHVPDLKDFVGGFAVLLKPEGVATFEFPHLLRQMQENQFDTIYHEHFSYLSLHVVQRVLRSRGCGCSTWRRWRRMGEFARVRVPCGGDAPGPAGGGARPGGGGGVRAGGGGGVSRLCPAGGGC